MANIFKKSNDYGQETAPGTENIAEISKINAQIEQCKSEKEHACVQLGELVYAISKKEESIDITQAPIVTLFDIIKKCDENNEKYKLELLRIKNIKLCANCGRECSSDSAFCSVCGFKLINEDIKPVNSNCPKCGTELSQDDIFCYNCGSKVKM